MRNLFATTALIATAMAGAASAQTMATTSTDLNVRSGPGVQHDVIGYIEGGDEATVEGCIESANWCEVQFEGGTGWVYGDYLNVGLGEEVKPLYPNRTEAQVAVIEAPAEDTNAAQDTAVGGATGAAMGALVGGPVGAVGGSTGAAANVEPAPEVQTYVVENPQEPVILDGEVVVGAGVPDTVTLYDVPDYPDYRYVTINGQTVLVEPDNRQIVYIYR
ncbi:DUF1236 domain-containing protein [Paracoccus sp. TK19116]|uniref:DUF1236 domain-containing protein n=1 Tax=Paracoccus albicereus TaxID=2922394 RepID=A0ABT1MST9_9RHOB|nr:DUF1236 domain-containing protein [Paracoccus albicereus]MCQ0971383.1 DUF1236 domain-containing protein [Paracoccus albicereus]